MSQAGTFLSGTGPGAFVQTLTGNTGAPVGPTLGNIDVLGSGGITVAGNPGTSTLTISPSGILATSYPTDNGTAIPALGVLNVEGGVTAPIAISNINTYADPNGSNNLKIALNNTIYWPDTNGAGTQGVIYFNGDRFLHNFGTSNNVFLGPNAGNFTNTANQNVGVGQEALLALTNSDSNTAIGTGALIALAGGDGNNVAIGTFAGSYLTSGGSNDLIGTNVAIDGGLGGLVSGSANTLIGSSDSTSGVPPTASNYRGAESSNIIIRNVGVLGESNTIRIGTAGAGLGQHNRCFIAGISGINPTTVNAAPVVIASDGQLGTLGVMTNGQVMIGSTGADPVLSTLTAGTGISITNGAGSITISGSGVFTTSYTNVNTTPYVVLSTDQYLGVDCSGSAITIQLPNAPATGRTFTIKDRTGNANTNNITVTTVGGAVNIDGATSYVMNTQYAAINVLFDGTTYQIW